MISITNPLRPLSARTSAALPDVSGKSADFARQMRRLCPGCLPLTAGSCTLCARCTYPDRPCRYPTKRLSSMEAYGLFVSDICTRSGLAYNYGPRTMTYTSCVLYNKE